MEKRWIGTWALLPNLNHLLHLQQQAIDNLPPAQKKPWHYKTQTSSKVHTSPLIHKKKKNKKNNNHTTNKNPWKALSATKPCKKPSVVPQWAMTPGQMENRTCRKNKNTPQTLQKVYIPRWSSKQRKAEKTGLKSTKIRDLWGLTDNAHTRELSCPSPFVPPLMLSCNTSPHHPSTMPLLFLFLPARKGTMTGLRKLREEESYRLLTTTTFKRKFVQWNLWVMGMIFRVLPDLQDGKRWWQTTTKKKKSRRGEAASLLGRSDGERERRGKRKGSGSEAEW